jgi:uncharacterized protein (TIGR03382 family)
MLPLIWSIAAADTLPGPPPSATCPREDYGCTTLDRDDGVCHSGVCVPLVEQPDGTLAPPPKPPASGFNLLCSTTGAPVGFVLGALGLLVVGRRSF